MKFSSKLLEDAVEAVSRLPGIGKKSALRLILHLLADDSGKNDRIVNSLQNLKKGIKSCKNCHNYSDNEICDICLSPSRRKTTVCVVESIRDVMAIEETQQYSGVYHILGGVISPLDGIGPENLNIDSLCKRVEEEKIEELIMAIAPTIEGETTVFYISKKLENKDIDISMIARGVSFGGELAYADEYTLAQSILSRQPYKQS